MDKFLFVVRKIAEVFWKILKILLKVVFEILKVVVLGVSKVVCFVLGVVKRIAQGMSEQDDFYYWHGGGDYE